MNLKIITLIVCSLSFLQDYNCLAQNQAKIIYSYKGYTYENKKTQESKESFIDRYNKSLEDFRHELTYDGKNILFRIADEMITDNKSNLSKMLYKTMPDTYISLNKKTLLHKIEISGNTFVIKDSLSNKWSITNEIKNISGYKCQKAILKDNETNKIIVEAWFTKEIPLPIGPSTYTGLPGLIIKLTVLDINQKPSIEYNVEDIYLSPQKEIKLPKQKTISMDEFNEILNGTRSRF